MSDVRPIWFVLADDGSGAVSPVCWQGRLTIAVFFATLLAAAVGPFVVAEATGLHGLGALSLVIPFLIFVPFLFLVRARLDSTQTRAEYQSKACRKESVG